MAKAVLHIGTHKTATTMIQDTLANNRKALAQHNIVYPTIGVFNGHHMLVSEWVNMNEQYKPVNGTDIIWKNLKEICGNTDKTVVFSSEEFSRATPTTVNMVELRERLSFFESVEVVCFLRDQKSYLQSIYLEVAKKRQPIAPKNMHKQAIDTYIAAGLNLDYNSLYDRLLTGFAKDEITFVSYNDALEYDGGVLGRFLKILNYGPDYAPLSLEKTSLNISADALTVWAACAISKKGPPSSTYLEIAQSTLEAEFGTPLKTSLFSPDEIEQLKFTFDPLNKKISDRISNIQPDFRLPAITCDETLLHRKNINADFITKLTAANRKR